jgi:hypothetical protein
VYISADTLAESTDLRTLVCADVLKRSPTCCRIEAVPFFNFDMLAAHVMNMNRTSAREGRRKYMQMISN